MRRLARFLVLMTLRVVAVMTVILWGVSRVASPTFVLPTGGGRGVGFAVAADGFVAGLPPAGSIPLPYFEVSEDRISLAEVFRPSGRSFLGDQFWLGTIRGTPLCGATFAAVLATSVLLYAVVCYAKGRRKRMAV